MVTLTAAHKSAIERIVSPDRVRFDQATRQSLSRDDGVRPPTLWPLSGNTVADGVVWPAREHEIVDLIRLARAEGIPLVPRGGGTAAAGGAVPADGGLVVDTTLLDGLVESDEPADEQSAEPTATVYAGTRWSTFAAALARQHLAPRTYPTSAPVSTVGGWVAQGGAGIGSFGYGWLDDSVVSTRIVDGQGRVYTLSGTELGGVLEAEGTTGIVTQVRLHVRPASRNGVAAMAFASTAQLALAARLATEFEVPAWSASFVDPGAVALLNTAQRERQLLLPERAYVAVFAYRTDDRDLAQALLRRIARATEAMWLPDEVARCQWQARFRPPRLLRRGHATAPADVVVPTLELAAMLDDLARAVPSGLAVEGTFVRNGETALHAYLDPAAPGAGAGRGLAFAMAVMRLAVRHRGRGLNTGRYFGPLARSILGLERLELVREMRHWLDPAGILNPGKVVFNNQSLGLALQIASHVPLVGGSPN